MEFQFGTNWAYYSHYVGDIFGAPLAIEGLMAFFLESTFIGLFFFGWDRLSQGQAPAGDRADGRGLQPVGPVDPDRQRLDAEPGGRRVQLHHHAHGADRLLGGDVQPHAQAKFVHTVSAGYVTGAMFVLSISSWYLLKGRDVEFAKRSSSGSRPPSASPRCPRSSCWATNRLHVGESQQTKLAAIEAMWETEPAPAGLQPARLAQRGSRQKNDWEIRFPT
jgi:cytochrome d ubiquinol oxidase subunit I